MCEGGAAGATPTYRGTLPKRLRKSACAPAPRRLYAKAASPQAEIRHVNLANRGANELAE